MDFQKLQSECIDLLAEPGDSRKKLQSLCSLLQARVAHYDWFGFYVARRGEALLDLGPFVGEPTDHVLIPFGRGICGQAAERGETFLVDDVSAALNYLACSLKVKSEIVVPVMDPQTGDVTGEIDIDSHSVAAFGAEDRDFLERLAVLVEADVAELRR
jgi:L-methionine (R)-S-oxide reductase